MWHLDPDIVTIGKAVAGGLPMGAYGVTAELGEQLDVARNVATGGTCSATRCRQRPRRQH
jgi:glutamate-1-semialdehyde aminotransferase